jgi:N-acetyltransferase
VVTVEPHLVEPLPVDPAVETAPVAPVVQAPAIPAV